MHKRSYKRISQDERPWLRVKPETDSDNDGFNLVNKKTTRWTIGNRRDKETRVLQTYSKYEFKKLMFQSFFADQSSSLLIYDNIDLVARQQMLVQQRLFKLHRMHSLSKSKNSCLFIGKSRTYNRQLFISRQTLRALTRVGIISGLVSGKRG